MTPDDFRRLALALPEAEEEAHQGHPDFRVRGKVFASLSPARADEAWGMVKLTPEQQAELLAAEPDTCAPFAGAWGRRGCTRVTLEGARPARVEEALRRAWRNTAPKRLVREHAELEGEA